MSILMLQRSLLCSLNLRNIRSLTTQSPNSCQDCVCKNDLKELIKQLKNSNETWSDWSNVFCLVSIGINGMMLFGLSMK